MPNVNRRALLKLGLAAGAISSLPPSIARALAIPADVRSGTIKDVDHVVILMQENRSFDHYFGTLKGVRGFGDRFPVPVGEKGGAPRTVWQQRLRDAAGERYITPYHLDTSAVFDIMRMEGTPHSWTDSQLAWDHGRMSAWPEQKTHRSMGYFRREDIPFQFALADTFTVCDAYHCSIMSSTNPNRMFLWTGTNDPAGQAGGPVLDNSHDSFPEKGYAPDAYTITSYAERLQEAGIDWRIYKDMADFFSNNPLVGIAAYRDSYLGKPGSNPELARRALTTYGLDRLKADVLDGSLPQVSYLIAPARGSEHPSRSSPAQGADYIADVIDALTANPRVWARTVLFIMFDENDGFFDHVPPPAPPSRDPENPQMLLGGSTVDLSGEYHERPGTGGEKTRDKSLLGRPYGLGARVPMFVVSPWSRGGLVNSQVFDHTSVIRFLEARFGVREPNISPWRRAVCGDLTSAFNFARPNDQPFAHLLPATRERAKRADAIPHQIDPMPPARNSLPVQEPGVRPAWPLPYQLETRPLMDDERGLIQLTFLNEGGAGAVFHVYDRLRLEQPPHRFTVEPGKRLQGEWPLLGADGRYDLWVCGPNSFHRHFVGNRSHAAWANAVAWRVENAAFTVQAGAGFDVRSGAYEAHAPWKASSNDPASTGLHRWSLAETNGWYDFLITTDAAPGFEWRIAGHWESGQISTTDPAQ